MKVIETDRHTYKHSERGPPSAGLFFNCPQQQAWARLQPGTQNSSECLTWVAGNKVLESPATSLGGINRKPESEGEPGLDPR